MYCASTSGLRPLFLDPNMIRIWFLFAKDAKPIDIIGEKRSAAFTPNRSVFSRCPAFFRTSA
jgi:hypothetical protein